MRKNFLLMIMIAVLLVACGQSIEPPTNVDSDNEHSNESIDDSQKVSKDNEPETSITKETTTDDSPKADDKSLTNLEIHYIDAGQADATLFQYTYEDKPYTILYDTGDWNKNDVINYLDAQHISFIDLVIISHPHADHAGQLAEVMNTYEVGEVWLSGNTATSQNFQDGLEAVLASDADYYEPRTGDTFDIGSLKIDVLHPSSISGQLNEESISLLFTYGDHKFLFTGDAGKKEELQMIDSGFDIQADILQLGHHGSNTSTDSKFIQVVDPDIAIYSAGSGNSYGHPHAEVVSLIQNAGITLYGTDVHGTILVTTDGKEYTVETKQDGTVSPKSTGASINKQTEPKKEKTNDKEVDKEPTNNTCININQASINEVQKIIHIGPERAEDLIDLRPYDSVEDLTSIKGIGPARIADIKDQGLACVK